MRTWEDTQLIEAVKTSDSLCEAILKLGLRPVGGNYKSIQKHVRRLRLDLSHFRRRKMFAPLLERARQSRLSDDEVFCENGVWVGTRIRKKVIRDGRLPYMCAKCGNPGLHMGSPLTLHLDHVNGNHRDCRWNNLRWLCPNCHSQTPTYARTTIKPQSSVPKPDRSDQLLLLDVDRRVRARKVPHDVVRETYARLGTYRKTSIELGISDTAVKKIVTGAGWKK